MKKILTFCLALLCVFGVTACETKASEFKGAGVTLTLTNKFKLMNSDADQLIIENKADDIAVLAKSDAKGSCADLSAYITAVLEKGGKEVEINHSDDGFYSAEYTSTVDKKEYKYLAVCLEGSEKYYTVTFGCNLNDYEKHSPSFIEWAQTITVA